MISSLDDKELLKIAEKTLLKYNLCDHCSGRIFSKIVSEITNEKRVKR